MDQSALWGFHSLCGTEAQSLTRKIRCSGIRGELFPGGLRTGISLPAGDICLPVVVQLDLIGVWLPAAYSETFLGDCLFRSETMCCPAAGTPAAC